MLFWHLLTTSQDYAYSLPTATAKKIRTIELKAGAPRRQGRPGEPRQPLNREQRRELEHENAQHAQAAYERTVADYTRQQRQRAADVERTAPART